MPLELLGGFVAERVVHVLETIDAERDRGESALLAL